ncbi:hypothetical protein [Microbacterium sp. BLY]|nr:hypothetical protein [Microbacterium sp. BLY]MBP3976627.1 hypothetical protein [Microbacterium sp. BLY]
MITSPSHDPRTTSETTTGEPPRLALYRDRGTDRPRTLATVETPAA